jgi:hypothetical protein
MENVLIDANDYQIVHIGMSTIRDGLQAIDVHTRIDLNDHKLLCEKLKNEIKGAVHCWRYSKYLVKVEVARMFSVQEVAEDINNAIIDYRKALMGPSK